MLRFFMFLLSIATLTAPIQAQESACPIERVVLKGGVLQTGASHPFFSEEGPPQKVAVGDFEIARQEIPYAALKEFLSLFTDKEQVEILQRNLVENPCLPLSQIRWGQAEALCEAMGGRLPTENEWEYAATVDNKTGRQYPWPSGDHFKPPANEEQPMEAMEDEIDMLVLIQNEETDEEPLPEMDEESIDAYLKKLDEEGAKADEKELKNQVPQHTLLQKKIVPVQNTFQGINNLQGMLGSLWEWTATVYQEIPKGAPNPTNTDSNRFRVLKGGVDSNIIRSPKSHNSRFQ